MHLFVTLNLFQGLLTCQYFKILNQVQNDSY